MINSIKIKDFTTHKLKELFNVKIIGTDTSIFYLSRLSFATNEMSNSLTYVVDKENFKFFLKSNFKILIISQELLDENNIDSNCTYIVTDNPEKLFSEIINYIFENNMYEKIDKSISPLSDIHESSFISDNVIIHKNVSIGKNCSIYENTIIDEGAVIGDNSVLGSPGLNIYINNENGNIFTESIGGVYIGKNVKVGNFTNINKGTAGRFTNIKDKTIIGSYVLLGHDVSIDQKSVVVDGSKLAGHVSIGKQVYIGINTTILQNINVGDFSKTGIGTVVTKDIKKNSFVIGNPGRVLA